MAFTTAGRELEELRRQIESALDDGTTDVALRDRFEQLAKDKPAFDGYTWLWGPKLYQRNKVVFRPFILNRFSQVHMISPLRWRVVHWKGEVGLVLDAWLKQADGADDIELFRRLYSWKNSEDRQGRDKRWRSEIAKRFAAAPTPASRTTVLAKYEAWLALDEDSALALYEADFALAAPFILKHLPYSYGDTRSGVWRRLHLSAGARGDTALADGLYKRQTKLADWQRDVLQAARAITDPQALNTELERRHPIGWGLDLGDTLFKLIELRERDVFPYVRSHLREVWSSWLRGAYDKMLDLARAKGWIDLWAALICVCSRPKEFNAEVVSLLSNRQLGDEEIERRLRLISGVSREWNHAGFGLALVHSLGDEAALELYQRFPRLLLGPFKAHVAPSWGSAHLPLLEAAIAKGDDELIDFLSSRFVTRNAWSSDKTIVAAAERASRYYEELRLDEVAFARRASAVLTQVPAYSIHRYNALIVENRLARLLFERSTAAYLGDERALRDLVEASEIHVQQLAYRILGENDPRARQAAVANLPVLIGTLLRPLHLGTRRLAFKALANVAKTSVADARKVLDKARQAQALPDKHYPKEELLTLIAGILHAHPEFAFESERPVVYRRRAA